MCEVDGKVALKLAANTLLIKKVRAVPERAEHLQRFHGGSHEAARVTEVHLGRISQEGRIRLQEILQVIICALHTGSQCAQRLFEEGANIDSFVTTPRLARGLDLGMPWIRCRQTGRVVLNATSIEPCRLGRRARVALRPLVGCERQEKGRPGSMGRGDEFATPLGAHGLRGFGGQVADEPFDVAGQGLEINRQLNSGTASDT